MVTEALSHSLKQTLQLLRLTESDFTDHRTLDLDPEIIHLASRPFPNDRVVSTVLAQYLNSERPIELLSLKQGTRVMELPLVDSHIKKIEKTYHCTECKPHNLSEESEFMEPCGKTRFLKNV